MDYWNYSGELPELPDCLKRHINKLRFIGAFMMISTPVIGWLTVLKIVQITFFLYLLGSFNMFFGIVFFIIGMAYDNPIDRSR